MGTELGRKDDLDSAVLAQSVGLQGGARARPHPLPVLRSCCLLTREH